MGVIPDAYCGRDTESFAYVIIKDRLPMILVKAMDAFHRSRSSLIEKMNLQSAEQDEADDEVKQIVGQLSKLRYEMMTDKPLTRLSGPATDVAKWNTYFDEYVSRNKCQPLWFEASWLYVECFMYRKISEMFETSKYFRSFDPFGKQKEEALETSMKAVEVLLHYLNNLTELVWDGEDSNAKVKCEFLNFLELSLWGNKCDLSIHGGATISNIKCSLDNLNNWRSKILVNDSQLIWDFIAKQSRESKFVLDIVLDNAGFELISDLCLVDFMMSSRIIDPDNCVVRFYVKKFPWFVSDTMKSDFIRTLDFMSTHESKIIQQYAAKWYNNVKEQKWTLVEDDFWTLPHDYSSMQAVDEKLYKQLSDSTFIIFKGDLNYRKLTGDLKWDERTQFIESLRQFLPSTLCTIRTIKADVVVGYSDLIDVNSLPKDYKFLGEFAVIQMATKSFPRT